MTYILVLDHRSVLLEGDDPTFASDPWFWPQIRQFASIAEAWAVTERWPVRHRDGFEVWELLEDPRQPVRDLFDLATASEVAHGV